MAAKTVVWNDVSLDVGWGVLRGKTCAVGSTNDGADGLQLVGLHGWLDNCNTFDTLIPLLPPRVKVLVLDLPGHGLSDHLPLGAHYNPFVYACSVHRAVLKFGWKCFVLMGHSMGAAVASVFTALFPEHVKALISLDYMSPRLGSKPSFVEECRKSAFFLIKAEELAQQPPLVYSEKEAIDRLVEARMYVPTATKSDIDQGAAQILLPRSTLQVEDGYVWSHDNKVKVSFLFLISGEKWIEIISAIKCPVLSIRATCGTGLFPVKFVKYIHDIYEKNAQWFQHEIVEGNHFVHLMNPDVVAPVINNFLEKVTKISLVQANL